MSSISPSQDRFRLASASDLDFVLRVFAQDARDAHYSPCYKDESRLEEFRISLEQVIRYGMMVRVGASGPEPLYARLFIFESQTGTYSWQANGFLYATEKSRGSGDQVTEIYMASIAPEVRGKGLGSRMIAGFQKLRPAGSELYARCYPASKTMARLFLRHGFVQEEKCLPDGVRQFAYTKPQVAALPKIRIALPSPRSMWRNAH